MAEPIPDREIRILLLSETFPCLRGAPRVVRGLWDAVAPDYWAASVASSGEKHSARFVLGVWNPHKLWNCGGFNLFDAMDIWDHPHHLAFQQWLADPWFA